MHCSLTSTNYCSLSNDNTASFICLLMFSFCIYSSQSVATTGSLLLIYPWLTRDWLVVLLGCPLLDGWLIDDWPTARASVTSCSLHVFWTAARETPVRVTIFLRLCPSFRSLVMLSFLTSGSPGLPPRFPPVLLRCSTDSWVLSLISSRSTSASPVSIPTTSGAIFPSPFVFRSPSSVRTWIPLLWRSWSRVTTSNMVLPMRSNLLRTSSSPSSSTERTACSWILWCSGVLLLTFSANTFEHPAFLSASTWGSVVWVVVETLAYP